MNFKAYIDGAIRRSEKKGISWGLPPESVEFLTSVTESYPEISLFVSTTS